MPAACSKNAHAAGRNYAARKQALHVGQADGRCPRSLVCAVRPRGRKAAGAAHAWSGRGGRGWLSCFALMPLNWYRVRPWSSRPQRSIAGPGGGLPPVLLASLSRALLHGPARHHRPLLALASRQLQQLRRRLRQLGFHPGRGLGLQGRTGGEPLEWMVSGIALHCGCPYPAEAVREAAVVTSGRRLFCSRQHSTAQWLSSQSKSEARLRCAQGLGRRQRLRGGQLLGGLLHKVRGTLQALLSQLASARLDLRHMSGTLRRLLLQPGSQQARGQAGAGSCTAAAAAARCSPGAGAAAAAAGAAPAPPCRSSRSSSHRPPPWASAHMHWASSLRAGQSGPGTWEVSHMDLFCQ